mmetsp:Transcript_109894/g.317743  ORF Transcript_109894/g.317743 Transcript_109894/m.317743 type:complete len:389 (+) Transcript_109894:85-1251(+)
MSATTTISDGDAHRFKTERSRQVGGIFRHECLRQSAFFKERNTQFLEAIISELEVEVYREGDTIMKKGDYSHKLYFLYCGRVDVLAGPEEAKVASLTSGDVFGEIAVFGERRRAATLRAAEFCDCRVIPLRAVRIILQRFPEDRAFFMKIAEDRTAQLQKLNDDSSWSASDLPSAGRYTARFGRELKGPAEWRRDPSHSPSRSPSPWSTATSSLPVSLPVFSPGRTASTGGTRHPTIDSDDVAADSATTANDESPSSNRGAGRSLRLQLPPTGGGGVGGLFLRTTARTSKFMRATPPELPPPVIRRPVPLSAGEVKESFATAARAATAAPSAPGSVSTEVSQLRTQYMGSVRGGTRSGSKSASIHGKSASKDSSRSVLAKDMVGSMSA